MNLTEETTTERKQINDGDLVMLRLCNLDQEHLKRKRHYNTWFRVMFIDNDGSLNGIKSEMM